MSKRSMFALAEFKEVNLFLRGMVPMIGFKHSVVTYERKKRIKGKSHYPIKKMLLLAADGITSLSVKPIRIITGLGLMISLFSFIAIIWIFVEYFIGNTITGWASMMCIICMLSGVQLICLGVIGEYIGKIYLETKQRPRYIISDRVNWKGCNDENLKEGK